MKDKTKYLLIGIIIGILIGLCMFYMITYLRFFRLQGLGNFSRAFNRSSIP